MSNPQPLITPILATPFAVISLPQAAEYNATLRALAAQKCTAGDPARGKNPLYLRSADDVLESQDPAVQQFLSLMLQGVYSVVIAVNEVSAAQLRAMKLEARAWISILRTDGGAPAASYPLSSWCGIYCVAAPAELSSRQDSGVLRLYETRLGTMFQDASNSTLRFPFKAAHYSWRPQPGQMAVFPASLQHEIAPLRTAGELVWVTVRVRFIAAGQSGFGRW